MGEAQARHGVGPCKHGRPMIGVCPRYMPGHDGFDGSESAGDGFFDAIIAAGGMPVLLPITSDPVLIDDYVDVCDGFAIPGGQGPSPSKWGEEALEDSFLSPERDSLEFPLVERVLAADKPLFCVCRGEQVLNVALGGTLAQDLTKLPVPEGMAHWRHQGVLNSPVHSVSVAEGSLLSSCVGGAREIQTNSNHVEAVREVGRGLVVSGRTSDGIVEALELPGKTFVLGVQWHPEYTWRTLETDRGLWEAFVAAAAARAEAAR